MRGKWSEEQVKVLFRNFPYASFAVPELVECVRSRWGGHSNRESGLYVFNVRTTND